jgi:hypothetical protein
MYTARPTMCEVTSARVAALCSSCSLQKYLERLRAALKKAGRTVGVNVHEGTQDPESWTRHSSFVSALFTVHAQ